MRQKENNGKSSKKAAAKAPPAGGKGEKSLARLAPLGEESSAASKAADKIGHGMRKSGGKAKAKR